MSRNTRCTQIPLALAVALAVGSGSAVWAQSNLCPEGSLLCLDLGNQVPIELGALPGEVDVALKFEPSTGTLRLSAVDALLCFDYSEVPTAPSLRAGLTLPNGILDTLHGINAAVISLGQVGGGAGASENLVYLEPTPDLDCRAFPNRLLTEIELNKEASLAGDNLNLFTSSFDRHEALPALELEIIDGRTGTPSLPQRNEVIAYTIRVVPRDRRNAAGSTETIFVEDVRVRDYAPPVNTNGQTLALSPIATITRCSIDGVDRVWQPEIGGPFEPACSIDAAGFLSFRDYSEDLSLPSNLQVEFDIERTVIGSVGTPAGPVTVIAVASASPEPDNFGSLEDAYHVFTFS